MIPIAAMVKSIRTAAASTHTGGNVRRHAANQTTSKRNGFSQAVLVSEHGLEVVAVVAVGRASAQTTLPAWAILTPTYTVPRKSRGKKRPLLSALLYY